ncbi:hypothetical protein KQX54_020021 [Cotesia glomerata]|uniref:Secreted protein n=1 Tax=Cotesia glomerata TaxID=32391 RepID=A0AAV7IFS5_COTGL|nr:hypothetical protein KQX54_020021 [Cotesia glomerata]
MATSPTLSIAGTRARAAALLATTATGTGSTDRRVVFIASSPGASSHDTRTWPHNWTPTTSVSGVHVEGLQMRDESNMECR